MDSLNPESRLNSLTCLYQIGMTLGRGGEGIESEVGRNRRREELSFIVFKEEVRLAWWKNM
jgi:hypothetical protein